MTRSATAGAELILIWYDSGACFEQVEPLLASRIFCMVKACLNIKRQQITGHCRINHEQENSSRQSEKLSD